MDHLRSALEMALSVLGTTSPNPAVGAVVVQDGRVVGRGATQPPGQAHAEVCALREAGELAQGAALYVTLEPCCHWGRTPPCTGAIIEAGIERVVVACDDPNPAVSGRGVARLREAGIEVTREDLPETRELYEAFAKHVNTGLPFVIAKFAMSLDGKIATRTGDSKWVTGPEARGLVQEMRREHDGILVGVNTVLADDPALTARDETGHPLERQPVRAVLDSRCRTPVQSQLLRQPGRTIVYATGAASPGDMRRLESAGAEVVCVSATDSGQVGAPDVLAHLGAEGVVSLIVEGGGAVLGSFFDAGLVDKVRAFIAPVIIGGADASSPVGGLGASAMSAAWRLEDTAMQQTGPDWLLTGYPRTGYPRTGYPRTGYPRHGC